MTFRNSFRPRPQEDRRVNRRILYFLFVLTMCSFQAPRIYTSKSGVLFAKRQQDNPNMYDAMCHADDATANGSFAPWAGTDVHFWGFENCCMLRGLASYVYNIYVDVCVL